MRCLLPIVRLTAKAVKAWWETLGITGRTTVPRGAVIFVANLPRLLTVDSAVQIGDLIAAETTIRLTDGLELDFPANSISVVKGRSGSGKSTLLSLLGLLLSPTSGHVAVAGNRNVLDNITEGALFAGFSPRRLRCAAKDLLGQVDLDTDLLSKRLPDSCATPRPRTRLHHRCRSAASQVLVLVDRPNSIDELIDVISSFGGINLQASTSAAIAATRDHATYCPPCFRSRGPALSELLTALEPPQS